MSTKRYFVYALVDPRDESVKYVGQSTQPQKRLKSHSSDKGNIRKFWWIRELEEQGLYPNMLILGEYQKDYVLVYEQAWIDHYVKNGADLMNKCVSQPSEQEIKRHNEWQEEERNKIYSRRELTLWEYFPRIMGVDGEAEANHLVLVVNNIISDSLRRGYYSTVRKETLLAIDMAKEEIKKWVNFLEGAQSVLKKAEQLNSSIDFLDGEENE